MVNKKQLMQRNEKLIEKLSLKSSKKAITDIRKSDSANKIFKLSFVVIFVLEIIKFESWSSISRSEY